jgi:hypothetical protein
MKKYYIVSIKHTSKGDTALTFWGPNRSGYAWHRKNAGVYSESDLGNIPDELNVPVEKEVVDKFWMNALDFNDKYVSVPNNPTVLRHLGLSDKLMKPKKFASCRMAFINTPVNELA